MLKIKNQIQYIQLIVFSSLFLPTACSSNSTEPEALKRPNIIEMLQEPISPAQLALPANWNDYTEEQKKSWERLKQVQVQILHRQHRFEKRQDIYSKCQGYFECVR